MSDKTGEILAARGLEYGEFAHNAELTQLLMSTVARHLSVRYNTGIRRHFNYPEAEALHMIFHKISRLVNGNPHHLDSWQDIAGYAELVVRDLGSTVVEEPLYGTYSSGTKSSKLF